MLYFLVKTASFNPKTLKWPSELSIIIELYAMRMMHVMQLIIKTTIWYDY